MKQLLSKNRNYYKANLHCHSTVSDGKCTPQELKTAYRKEGYSIIAFTDHNVMIPHHDLSDDNFLALTGYEIDLCEDYSVVGFPKVKACHLCLISLEKDKQQQICWHRTDYLQSNAVNYRDKVCFDETEPDFVRVYGPECINEIIRRGREANFFVTYNHPKWSMESLEQYKYYKNMNAVEIYNNMSFIEGRDEYNPDVYDDLLRDGKRIYCIATDDTHSFHPFGSPYNDSFGGFTMIQAECLTYESVAESLKNGNFYASTGPLIYDLSFNDGKVSIECSDSKVISLTTGIRTVQTVRAEKDKSVSKAVFDVGKGDVYFRITVTDEHGKYANTNAYFIDEL
ncbi:MAG: CehA/McbA family metallohydrolase [Clostridia bacterium]|nr:CehA/McbA family metallohydrolase [Clostridia bacterium]